MKAERHQNHQAGSPSISPCCTADSFWPKSPVLSDIYLQKVRFPFKTDAVIEKNRWGAPSEQMRSSLAVRNQILQFCQAQILKCFSPGCFREKGGRNLYFGWWEPAVNTDGNFMACLMLVYFNKKNKFQQQHNFFPSVLHVLQYWNKSSPLSWNLSSLCSAQFIPTLPLKWRRAH